MTVPNVKSATKDQHAKHLVILVHGINTEALWMELVKPALEEEGFVVATTSYGSYSVLRFLLPFKFLRTTAADRILRNIFTAQKIHKPERMSVISHSFGTHVIATLLAEQPQFEWNRIIFCGSVVKDTFPLDHYLDRFRQPILNEVGKHDVWPALAESLSWAYGSIGSKGLHHPAVETRWHTGYKHSDFLTAKFTKKYWVPFLRNGTVVRGDRPVALPAWIRVIASLPLRYLFPVIVLATSLLFAVQSTSLIPEIWLQRFQGDMPALYPETDATRVQSFTFQTAPEEIKPGLREWVRVAPDRWKQVYPDKTVEFAKVVKRIHLDICDGTVVSDTANSTFQGFIPDKNCLDQRFLFRRLTDGLHWTPYAQLNDVR